MTPLEWVAAFFAVIGIVYTSVCIYQLSFNHKTMTEGQQKEHLAIMVMMFMVALLNAKSLFMAILIITNENI